MQPDVGASGIRSVARNRIYLHGDKFCDGSCWVQIESHIVILSLRAMPCCSHCLSSIYPIALLFLHCSSRLALASTLLTFVHSPPCLSCFSISKSSLDGPQQINELEVKTKQSRLLPRSWEAGRIRLETRIPRAMARDKSAGMTNSGQPEFVRSLVKMRLVASFFLFNNFCNICWCANPLDMGCVRITIKKQRK